MNDHLIHALHSRACRQRPAVLAVCLLVLSGYASMAEATIIHVDTTEQKISGVDGCSLQEAIWAANIGNSQAIVVDLDNNIDLIDTECLLEDDGLPGYTIILPGDETFSMSSIVDDPFNYVGPTATPIVLADIIIEANGALIEHVPNGIPFRAFAVGVRGFATGEPLIPGSGSLTIRNVHIRGFAVKGGDGTGGGGGGLGAGGAVYVHGGGLTVENCTFEANSVYGGNGSRNVLNTGGGGGGGLAGNGGRAGLPPQETGGDLGGGGGGGGGARGDGGEGVSDCGSPCLGIGASGGGGGGTLGAGGDGDGTNEFGVAESAGGFRCGGRGGRFDLNPLDSVHNGKNGSCPGGGGGGGRDSVYAFGELFGGHGGEGDYGGGGGGGANLFATRGDGARGGFGGGGGAATPESNGLVGPCSPNGGNGGFGGGGGAAYGGEACLFDTGGGSGGSFAGNAGQRDGGGGAGLGGAIFNHSGSVLVMNSTFTANGAARGVAGNWPNNEPISHSGQDQGAAIFSVGGSLTVLNSTIYDNEGTSSINGGAGIVVYAPGYDIFSPVPQVPPTYFELRNTIIAGNTAGSVVTKECRLINSDSNSVVFAGSGNLITANDNCTSGLVSSEDPLLESLQLNPPGLTPTLALGEDSPAIDAADPATALDTDQRGVARPVGAESDIGAFEWGAVVAKCKDVTVSAGANCTAHASIDDGSFAPGGGEVVLSQAPPGPYALGMTQVTLTATHESGESDSCQAKVTVVDDTPPVITVSTATSVLSPMRKHDLVNVGLGAEATDACSVAPTTFQVEVFGDEDDETPTSGDLTVFSPDAVDLATGTLRLRAERMDSADGRVYLMVLSGADSAGNTGYGCATVTVPHNSSPASAALVLGQAEDARAYCAANDGAAPVGYHVIGDGPQIGPKPKK